MNKYYTMIEEQGAIFVLSSSTLRKWKRDIDTLPKNKAYWDRLRWLEKAGYRYIYPKDIKDYGDL